LNNEFHLCPIGVVGEICVGGVGITEEYINKPEITAEKIVPSPFKENDRLFKTGDLGRWLPDGNIEYIGRRDDQVKVRGFRIELGEIESVIGRVPTVNQCAVLAKKSSEIYDKQLVAFVEGRSDFDKKEVQTYLKSQLPDYMVPALIVELETIPLTTSGKIDKKTLKDFDVSTYAAKKTVEPRNETEGKLAQIWKTILDIEQVGVYDNFFELGGHSLLATRMLSAIKKVFDISIPINILFQFTSIAELSEYVDLMDAVEQVEEENADVQVIEL